MSFLFEDCTKDSCDIYEQPNSTPKELEEMFEILITAVEEPNITKTNKIEMVKYYLDSLEKVLSKNHIKSLFSY